MTRRFSRRAALGGLGAMVASGALADTLTVSPRPPRRPRGIGAPSIDALIARARLDGSVTFAVFDAADGRLLESRDGRRGQPPASSLKAITAAYAHERLGGGHRFETRLLGRGPVEDGVLRGDLILAGGGDPTLDTTGLARLARSLPGVREVEGRLLTYGGALPFVPKLDPEQADHLGYNPAVSGLNLNFNRVHFSWERTGGRYLVSLDARAGEYAPAITSARMRIEPRRMPVYTYRQADGVDEWTVARDALGPGGSRWLPVRNPSRYAADVLGALARSDGVALPSGGEAGEPAGVELARVASAPLLDVTAGMLRHSTNLTAEALGLAASGAPELEGSTAAMGAWAGRALGMEGGRLVDHSGLNVETRVSAEAMAGAMVRLTPVHPVARRLKPFGMRDAEGRPVEHPVRVLAKTGTLNFVSALVGFAEPPSGRTLAFAVLASDVPRRARAAERGEEIPDGARAWNRRAKALQQGLVERWSALYG
jgi:D-alanyl-D-alanine carboxypeptidase/D-alanyl-D-alanine-endopeptidase (penicillin-binding protein 4)